MYVYGVSRRDHSSGCADLLLYILFAIICSIVGICELSLLITMQS